MGFPNKVIFLASKNKTKQKKANKKEERWRSTLKKGRTALGGMCECSALLTQFTPQPSHRLRRQEVGAFWLEVSKVKTWGCQRNWKLKEKGTLKAMDLQTA